MMSVISGRVAHFAMELHRSLVQNTEMLKEDPVIAGGAAPHPAHKLSKWICNKMWVH